MEQDKKKLPFYMVREFDGCISKKDKKAEELHIVVEHSRISPPEINGKVIGDNRTYEKIEPVFREREGYSSLRSTDLFISIESDKIVIEKIGRLAEGKTKKQVVPMKTAELSLLNIKYRHKTGTNTRKRAIQYLVSDIKNLSYIFPFKYKKYEKGTIPKIDKNFLGTFDNFRVYVVKYDVYDDFDGKAFLERSIVTLHLETDSVSKDLSDEDFVKTTKNIVNDILLLSSFLCKHWIRWYGYIFNTSEYSETFYRVVSSTAEYKIGYDEMVVKPKNVKQFLRKGFRKLRKLREEQFDLKKPIIYIINGNEADYLEAEFNTTFLALEKLKDIYSIKKKIDKNIKPKEYNKLQRKLKKLINKELKDPTFVIQKLPELNRRPVRYIFEKMMERYKVDWTDIYPPNSDLTIINTRNKLFHSSTHPKPELIDKELQRLQILLSRIILKMLGWDDTSEVIDRRVYGFLVR